MSIASFNYEAAIGGATVTLQAVHAACFVLGSLAIYAGNNDDGTQQGHSLFLGKKTFYTLTCLVGCLTYCAENRPQDGAFGFFGGLSVWNGFPVCYCMMNAPRIDPVYVKSDSGCSTPCMGNPNQACGFESNSDRLYTRAAIFSFFDTLETDDGSMLNLT